MQDQGETLEVEGLIRKGPFWLGGAPAASVSLALDACGPGWAPVGMCTSYLPVQCLHQPGIPEQEGIGTKPSGPQDEWYWNLGLWGALGPGRMSTLGVPCALSGLSC